MNEMTEAKIRRAMAYYYATISQIDHHVGRLVALLKDKNLYDDTLILYNSDHGDYMGYHHLLLKGNHIRATHPRSAHREVSPAKSRPAPSAMPSLTA